MDVFALGLSAYGVRLVAGQDFGSVIWLFVVLIAVLLLAYYATRFIATRGAGYTKTSRMRVKERVALARDKSVVLLETKETYYLLGVTVQNVQLIAAVPRGELGELTTEEAASTPGGKGVVDIMGLFGGKKGTSLFGSRRDKQRGEQKEGELDVLIEQMHRRRSERYSAYGGNKPEFQEILNDSVQNSVKDDEK